MADVADIVISGISGRFPECNNVEELKEALFEGRYLVTEDDRRFPKVVKDMPHYMGKVPEIDKFDASFFDMHPKQASFTDPRHRILLETVYEAIVDAGYNPAELRGSKTGVFVGLSDFSNIEEMRREEISGYILLGTSLFSASNRVSHAFDFRGPSISLDTACSSSMDALAVAYQKLKLGEIENAIVCGTHLILHPHSDQLYDSFSLLSPDGLSRVFSKNRNGFSRSEAVCSAFLQMKKNSRRIYATILGSKGNSGGYNKDGFTFPSVEGQFGLVKELYSECKINPDDVIYMEIHGTGTLIGDAIECGSMTKMFCEKQRKYPLLIGSIKSNIGHIEMSSGLVSTIKAIITMESGVIPANLNAEPIDTDLPGIKEGTLKVVTKNTKLNTGLVGVNSFGIGGTNAHAVFKPNENILKPVVNRKHRLVQLSGRTEEAVDYFLNEIEKSQREEEFLGLLDEIHKVNIEGHIFRGYVVLGENVVRSVTKQTHEKRPIVFIYSGVGSQCPGIGKYLMKFEVFRNVFTRCAEVVKPFGVDLQQIITSHSTEILKNMENTFTIIVAIQISLTEFLYSLGIRPDLFAGHSSGEIGCAYANGDLTPEQAVLLAYARGYALNQEERSLGQMAAVGLSKEEIQDILPENVIVACQNGKDSVTISGLAEDIQPLVKKLKENGTFAQLVNTGGCAFHSKYIRKCTKHFLTFAKKVIPNPKPRSEKWISTVVPPEKVDEQWANHNSPEYHARNFEDKVLFDQIYDRIPQNAIVIEIAPNGILQSILKRELNPENILMTLTRKNADDHEQFLLSAIGKLFNAGAQPNLRNLYKETVFPVSRGTKMIAPLVKWDHSTTWYVPYWKNQESFGDVVKINLSEESHSYLKGHKVDGRVLMPAITFLHMVWKLVAAKSLKDHLEIPVVFEDVKFLRATILSENETIEFLVNVMKETGYFEISEGNSVVVTGKIRTPKNINQEYKTSQEILKKGNDVIIWKRDEFYKNTMLRKTIYDGVFKGILECHVNGYTGSIEWMGNFVAFVDNLIQLVMLEDSSKSLILLSTIKKFVIDPQVFMKEVTENKYVSAERDPYIRTVRSKGIELSGLEYKRGPKREKTQPDPLLENYKFVHYDSVTNSNYNLFTSFTIALQIIRQNTKGVLKRMTVCEIKDEEIENNNEEISKEFQKICEKIVVTDIYYSVMKFNDIDSTFDAVIFNTNLSHNLKIKDIDNNVRENGYIIYIGQGDELDQSNFGIIFKTPSLSLLRQKQNFPDNYDVINIKNYNFKWLDKLKELSYNSDKEVVFLISEKEETSGIIGLQKCLMAEKVDVQFKAVLFCGNTDLVSVDNQFYSKQLAKQLSINVLQDGDWGTFVHIPLDEVKDRFVSNATISPKHLGQLSSFNWVERPTVTVEDKDSSTIVTIHYSALNPIDAQIATTKLYIPKVIPTDFEYDLGFEYSGVTASGQRFMGIVSRGGLSLQVKSDPNLTWEVPPSWSLEQAATVPVTYCMCYYAMVIRGQMEQGESILIHAPHGFTIAAIPVALSFNSPVFVTVQNQSEKNLVKKLWPQIEVGLVQDSSFAERFKLKTDGKGLDIILSAFDDELFEKSLSFLSSGGRVLDLSATHSLKLFYEYSYHRVSLDVLLKQSATVKNKIRKLVLEGISSGLVTPLPSASFKDSDVVSAFKLLNLETNFKKVLIQIIKNEASVTHAVPKIFFDPNKVYVIVGGLGGIGLELTDWMLTRGATKIILNGRRNIYNGHQSFCLKTWSEYKNVVVKVIVSDAITLSGAEELIQQAQEFGPVGGIFNLALVLMDANLNEQTQEKFEAVLNPKIKLSENLDTVTRQHCPVLDHFVLFSSAATGRGNMGQTNYGMANSAMERLCEKRRKENLPGLAIQFGPIADVGILGAADNKEFFYSLPQNINSCFDALETCMIQDCIVCSSVVIPDKKSLRTNITKSSAHMVASILGLENIDSIDKNISLSRLGLDSLMITEIRQMLYRNYHLELDLEGIGALTFEYLSNLQNNNIKNNTSIRIPSVKKTTSPLLTNSRILKINDCETKSGKPSIFITSPVDGNFDSLKMLANNLKVAVFGLQYTKETSFETVQETAKHFVSLIKNNQKQGPYLICGYSYGATVGFEVGLQLEKEGHAVDLIAIDGSPVYVKSLRSDSLKTKNNILTEFANVFTNVSQNKVELVLKDSNTLEESLNFICQLISQDSELNLKYVNGAAEQFRRRWKAYYDYEPVEIFKGKVLLVRRMDNSQISEDYGLQKHCHQIVEVKKLNGDHHTVLLGTNLMKLSDIINERIEKRTSNGQL